MSRIALLRALPALALIGLVSVATGGEGRILVPTVTGRVSHHRQYNIHSKTAGAIHQASKSAPLSVNGNHPAPVIHECRQMGRLAPQACADIKHPIPFPGG